MMKRQIFISGATGYLGRNLIPLLLNRGHKVAGLVRKGSERKLVPGCEAVPGDALNADSYKDAISGDTFVHLIGVPHPSPAKAELFRTIDLPAVKASIIAATHAKIAHFVYLSVAHPAPVMKAYVQTRVEAEELIRASGFNASFLQPWYVLGPGHRWAYALLPFYWILEKIPSTRDGALRMGLVTLKQMMAAMIHAVENPAQGIRVIDVPQIRNF